MLRGNHDGGEIEAIPLVGASAAQRPPLAETVGNCVTIEVDVKFTFLWTDARCATEAAVVDFFAVVVSRAIAIGPEA